VGEVALGGAHARGEGRTVLKRKGGKRVTLCGNVGKRGRGVIHVKKVVSTAGVAKG